jgi:hypothetical protein
VTRLAVAGELLAADALTAPDRSLQVADVIYSASPRPLTWPHAILDRYPGCAVVAVPARDGGYAVAARAGRPGSLIYFPQNGRWLHVAVDEPGFGALVHATFVHSWLAAGWPLAALDQAYLAAIVSDDSRTTRPVTRVKVALYYEVSRTPGSPRRRAIPSASGASTAE